MENSVKYYLEQALEYAYSTFYSVGGKIRSARSFRKLTQKDLGVKCGFPETTATQRISQYEQNQKYPKDEQIKILCDALGIDESAFYKLDLRDGKLACHILFDLEDAQGLQPVKINGKYYLAFRSPSYDYRDNISYDKFLEDWHKKLTELLPNEPSNGETVINPSAEYKIWKLAYFKNHGQSNSDNKK